MSQLVSKQSGYAIIALLVLSVSISFPVYASTNGNMSSNVMSKMMKDEKSMGMDKVESPLKQLKHGISFHDIKCKPGFSLVSRLSDNSPACVKTSSVAMLVARGWAANSDTMNKMMNQNMTNMHDMINHTMSDGSMMKDKEMTTGKMENKSMTEAMPEEKMKMSESSAMPQSSIDESKYADAPALVGISDYINTTPAKLAQEMKGKIIVYDFWTFNCINCIHTLPHVVDLNNKYLGKGVLVIGIHSPETVFEKDLNNVKDAVNKYNIKYPVVTDNEFQTWNAFGNHYWPHIYIADAQGKIRYDHIGEEGYDEIDNTVTSLLVEQEKQKPKELVMG